MIKQILLGLVFCVSAIGAQATIEIFELDPCAPEDLNLRRQNGQLTLVGAFPTSYIGGSGSPNCSTDYKNLYFGTYAIDTESRLSVMNIELSDHMHFGVFPSLNQILVFKENFVSSYNLKSLRPQHVTTLNVELDSLWSYGMSKEFVTPQGTFFIDVWMDYSGEGALPLRNFVIYRASVEGNIELFHHYKKSSTPEINYLIDDDFITPDGNFAILMMSDDDQTEHLIVSIDLKTHLVTEKTFSKDRYSGEPPIAHQLVMHNGRWALVVFARNQLMFLDPVTLDEIARIPHALANGGEGRLKIRLAPWDSTQLIVSDFWAEDNTSRPFVRDNIYDLNTLQLISARESQVAIKRCEPLNQKLYCFVHSENPEVMNIIDFQSRRVIDTFSTPTDTYYPIVNFENSLYFRAGNRLYKFTR